LKIIKIRIKQRDGEVLPVEEAQLVCGAGIEGDERKTPEGKEISLLDETSARAVRSLAGLCSQSFMENITYEGRTEDFVMGGVYALGGAKIVITQIGKPCLEECPLYQAGIRCSLPHNLLFAGVVEPGSVKTGDTFEIIKLHD
jgi:MOSC domain-containing protein YiiM